MATAMSTARTANETESGSVTPANLVEIEKKVGRRTKTERKIVATGMIEIVTETAVRGSREGGTVENETGVSVIVAMTEKGVAVITATEIGGTGIGLVPLLFQGLLPVTGEGPAQGLLRVTAGGKQVDLTWLPQVPLRSPVLQFQVKFLGCLQQCQASFQRCSRSVALSLEVFLECQHKL
jgi:hypothetical protein